MNILLWVLQALIALHTAIGAVWKFSNSELAIPSLNVISHGIWMAMSVLELLCSLCLALPAIYKPSAVLVPFAAGFIVLEMLLFCAVHMRSGDANYSPMVYWLVAAAICGFVAYSRAALMPLPST